MLPVAACGRREVSLYSENTHNACLLQVNDASRPAIISDIRCHYPEGRLHIAEDFDVVDVTKEAINVRKRLVPQTSWGYWKADANVPQQAGSHMTSEL